MSISNLKNYQWVPNDILDFSDMPVTESILNVWVRHRADNKGYNAITFSRQSSSGNYDTFKAGGIIYTNNAWTEEKPTVKFTEDYTESNLIAFLEANGELEYIEPVQTKRRKGYLQDKDLTKILLPYAYALKNLDGTDKPIDPVKVIVEASQGETDHGQITQEQLITLRARFDNAVYFNNEKYDLNDDMSEPDLLVYTHVGMTSNEEYYLKSISIKPSTLAWNLRVIELVGKDYVDSKEVITEVNAIPTATEDSPHLINFGGALYWKRVRHWDAPVEDDGDLFITQAFDAADEETNLMIY